MSTPSPRPTIPYSPVSRETCEDNHPATHEEREDSTCARAARSFVAASVLAALVLRRGAYGIAQLQQG